LLHSPEAVAAMPIPQLVQAPSPKEGALLCVGSKSWVKREFARQTLNPKTL